MHVAGTLSNQQTTLENLCTLVCDDHNIKCVLVMMLLLIMISCLVLWYMLKYVSFVSTGNPAAAAALEIKNIIFTMHPYSTIDTCFIQLNCIFTERFCINHFLCCCCLLLWLLFSILLIGLLLNFVVQLLCLSLVSLFCSFLSFEH